MRAPFWQVFCPRPLQAHVYNEPGFSLSPLLESVASGRMVAVDLAAVDHRPLVRALNVLLKRAWMGAVEFAGAARRRALLDGRTAPEMGPAVVVFNGYEDLVLAGSDDADADRLAFAGAPESECVPIVAVRSLSVLLDVLGGRRSCARLLDTLSSRLVLSADLAASAAFLDGFLWAGSGACGARACPDVLLSLDPEYGVCQVLREGRLEAPVEVALYPPWLSLTPVVFLVVDGVLLQPLRGDHHRLASVVRRDPDRFSAVSTHSDRLPAVMVRSASVSRRRPIPKTISSGQRATGTASSASARYSGPTSLLALVQALRP